MTRHLFLYGTLLPGLAPRQLAPYLEQLRDCGPASVAGRLYDLGPFPGAVVDPAASTKVHGRVFELPDDPQVLDALDHYEGDKLFARTTADVTMHDGQSQTAWVYVYRLDLSDATPIEHGNYLRWRQEHPT